MIRSDGHPWWCPVPVLPMSLPVPILHLGMVKQACDLKSHAQHLHLRLDPWPSKWKFYMVTIWLPRLTLSTSYRIECKTEIDWKMGITMADCGDWLHDVMLSIGTNSAVRQITAYYTRLRWQDCHLNPG